MEGGRKAQKEERNKKKERGEGCERRIRQNRMEEVLRMKSEEIKQIKGRTRGNIGDMKQGREIKRGRRKK